MCRTPSESPPKVAPHENAAHSSNFGNTVQGVDSAQGAGSCVSRSPPNLNPSPRNFTALQAAVIVPGFLYGARDFQPLAEALTARGIPSV
eukprot:8899783-Pyramimonas_sp.AAC.1